MRKDLIALISYSITNIATTLLLKLAGTVSVSENGEERGFFHPFMQTEIMIIGEALCILPYFLFERGKRKQAGDKLPSRVTLCLLPLALDLSSSILIFVALNYLSASVYSVLAGEVVAFTAVFSRIFLKSKISRAQIIGSVLTVVSAVIAGIGESFGDQSSEQLKLLVLGIGLVTIAMALQAAQAVTYQRIYSRYDISALEMVGYQGVVGTFFWTALLILANHVGCPFAEAQCVFDSSGHTHLPLSLHPPSNQSLLTLSARDCDRVYGRLLSIFQRARQECLLAGAQPGLPVYGGAVQLRPEHCDRHGQRLHALHHQDILEQPGVGHRDHRDGGRGGEGRAHLVVAGPGGHTGKAGRLCPLGSGLADILWAYLQGGTGSKARERRSGPTFECDQRNGLMISRFFLDFTQNSGEAMGINLAEPSKATFEVAQYLNTFSFHLQGDSFLPLVRGNEKCETFLKMPIMAGVVNSYRTVYKTTSIKDSSLQGNPKYNHMILKIRRSEVISIYINLTYISKRTLFSCVSGKPLSSFFYILLYSFMQGKTFKNDLVIQNRLLKNQTKK